jgi:uncharacterized membrane protein affecting hemolysin expression
LYEGIIGDPKIEYIVSTFIIDLVIFVLIINIFVIIVGAFKEFRLNHTISSNRKIFIERLNKILIEQKLERER